MIINKILYKLLPRAGTIISYALLKSKPAACSEPLFGIIAKSDNFFT
jgi:hypothetical protein